MLGQESHRWSVLLQTPEQALHCCCLTLRSHDTKAQLWLHGKMKLWCSGIPFIKPVSLTKLKFIFNFQILHAELRELPPYRFSLKCQDLQVHLKLKLPALSPCLQQLSFPQKSNEQSLSFHIWGNICIVASDPGVCGGTVHCYSPKDLLLYKVPRYAPAASKEAAASSNNRLSSSKPTLSPNKLKEISRWLLKLPNRSNCVSFLLF